MHNFEDYTLIIYETAKAYHSDVPEHRFVAYLLEIPEASLHEYGPTQEDAIRNLREGFTSFQKECEERNVTLPSPRRRDKEEFSGRIVLRMPSWLHQAINEFAAHEASSINSYLVNRLIKTVTIEEMVEKFYERQTTFFRQLSYEIRTEQMETKVARTMVPNLELYTTPKEISYKKVV